MSPLDRRPDEAPEHLDVIVVGAGLSGVGAACHLAAQCPQKSFAILEARGAIGGTWDLFRCPGIRSDSDMFTLGYSFRPWEQAEAIADGPAILDYIRETARAYGVDAAVRYGHRVGAAEWSTPEQRWTVRIQRGEEDEPATLTCGFLFGCTGYYRYDEGYSPQLAGTERFGGEIVHPQHWPDDLDHRGKRVVVIGSGATAVTIVPAIAGEAERVTMLQRSPSYVIALPNRDPIAAALQRRLPARLAHPLVRWKNVMLTQLFYRLSRLLPNLVSRLIKRGVERHMPDGYSADPDFEPSYDPWDQRVCVVPDGDLFAALRSGEAEIVTDSIETFTETGLLLSSGAELEADLIITATGLNLLALGGIELRVDGRPTELSDTVGYKGLMLSGVPNLALTLGYTNASWTLKSDLVDTYVCRLLNHMDRHGYTQCTPLAPDPSEPTAPFIDLRAGYVLRSVDELPRQGARWPWRLRQSYPRDVLPLRHGSLDDEGVEFSTAPRKPAERCAAFPILDR